MRWMLVLVVCVGCGSKDPAPTSGCDLSGVYRLRFDAQVGQWLWLRFEVHKNMTATLLAPNAISTKDNTLKIDPDPPACKLAAIARTERGELLASLTVDSKTHAVTGTLRGVGMREGIAITGVRDLGPQQSRHACVVPGIYKLVIPAEQEWTSALHQSCERASVKVSFLVEYLGDKLVLDQLDHEGNAAWAAEDVFVADDDPCQLEVRFRHDDWYTYTKLTFAGDKVTAQTTSASVEVSEDGDVWRCEIANPMAWVER